MKSALCGSRNLHLAQSNIGGKDRGYIFEQPRWIMQQRSHDILRSIVR